MSINRAFYDYFPTKRWDSDLPEKERKALFKLSYTLNKYNLEQRITRMNLAKRKFYFISKLNFYKEKYEPGSSILEILKDMN